MAVTKLGDRFQIEPPMLVLYDMSEHKVLRSVPWSGDDDPHFFIELQSSPDGELLYVFVNEIRIFNTSALAQVDQWDREPPTLVVDLPEHRVLQKVRFDGRPRMALRTSSNGRVIYIYEAGPTIDLYDAAGFKYMRTITLDSDMTYESFHVLPPRPQAMPTATPRR